MNSYNFFLKYKVPTKYFDDIEATLDLIYEAGCDDAMVNYGTTGIIKLDCDTTAGSAQDAFDIMSAKFKKAIPEARLVEAGPDLVEATEIARVMGVSRQRFRQLFTQNADSFPHYIHGGSTQVWHLAQVIGWVLSNNRTLAKGDANQLFDLSRAAMKFNKATTEELLRELH